MLRETTEQSEKNFHPYPGRSLADQDLDVLVELFQQARQLVGISLEIGDRLRKLALQLQEVPSRELH